MRNMRQTTTKKATVGAIVAIQMDRRDVSHPNAVLGVAYKVANVVTGGCLVATVHGIIVKDGKKNLYIPKSRYNVQDEDAVVSEALKKLQQSVINKTFEETTFAKITMQKAHALEYPMAQPT
jgi:hypothetical protein